jgi:hypothetical protein
LEISFFFPKVISVLEATRAPPSPCLAI